MRVTQIVPLGLLWLRRAVQMEITPTDPRTTKVGRCCVVSHRTSADESIARFCADAIVIAAGWGEGMSM